MASIFRNLTTGEVTAPVRLTIPSGGGKCAFYSGKGRVVGMVHGEGPAADWVSPSNALIGTMSLIDSERGGTRVTVLGVLVPGPFLGRRKRRARKPAETGGNGERRLRHAGTGQPLGPLCGPARGSSP
jgi:hypothetical protein